jgi:polysaccharide biosynthesis protein PslH
VKILWLKSELLHPVDKGGKIRTYQMLKHLKRDHHITYLSLRNPGLTREDFDAAREYCQKLVTVSWKEARKFSAKFYRDLAANFRSPVPYAVEKYRSEPMRRAIELEISGGNYDLVVCDFLVPSINLPEEMNCASVLFQHNVESMIWQRHYETQSSRLKKRFFFNQWQKMQAYERQACRRFDAVIAVSGVDRDLMREQFSLGEVYDVPTGVDTDYFQPLGGERQPAEVVFTGSMDWMPNEDAILYFADNILPLITRALPDVKLTVVGRNPTGRVRALAEANRQIKITGRVEDVRPYVDRASAYVVPIRVGGGTRLKIYEAMAMEKVVISTTVGAEGLPVRDGEELIIADRPGEFADAVIRTLRDEQFARKIGQSARRVVCEQFGWNMAATVFADVCERVVRTGSQRRAA